MRKLEKRGDQILSRAQFAVRLLKYASIAALLNLGLLIAGTLGIHYTEGLDWLDAALDTAMLITGNGPPREAHTAAGKIFQILFGIFGVIGFVLVLSLILIPIFHRIMHRFHIVPDDEDEDGTGATV